MSWLPRMAIVGTAAGETDGDYEGWTVQLFWLGWLFEIALLKRERML